MWRESVVFAFGGTFGGIGTEKHKRVLPFCVAKVWWPICTDKTELNSTPNREGNNDLESWVNSQPGRSRPLPSLHLSRVCVVRPWAMSHDSYSDRRFNAESWSVPFEVFSGGFCSLDTHIALSLLNFLSSLLDQSPIPMQISPITSIITSEGNILRRLWVYFHADASPNDITL